MANQYTPKKADAEKAIHLFKEAEEEFQKALDELENEYYKMDDNDPQMSTVISILEDYNRLPTFNDTIEEELLDEYETAKETEATQEEKDWILYKIQVALRRSFEDDYKGELYKILYKNKLIEKR